MKNLKIADGDKFRYYIENLSTSRNQLVEIDYDEETNIMSSPFIPWFFGDGIPFSGTGIYLYVNNEMYFQETGPFVVKPTLGTKDGNYYPVEFDDPSGFHFSGYVDIHWLYTGATISSLTDVGSVYMYDLSAVPRYGEYWYLTHVVYDNYMFHYYEHASNTDAKFLDGDGLYGCHVYTGEIITGSGEYAGKWTVSDDRIPCYYRKDSYIPATASTITNHDGKTKYCVDYGGKTMMCYCGSTYNNLPVMRGDDYCLLEKHPKSERYYEDSIYPGVAYDRQQYGVFYNNPNRLLNFVDPNPTGGGAGR